MVHCPQRQLHTCTIEPLGTRLAMLFFVHVMEHCQQCRQGQIFRLCPVAPFDMRLPMLLIRQQLRPTATTSSAVLRWLQEVSGNLDLGASLEVIRERDFWRDAHTTVQVVPHRLPGITFALYVCPCSHQEIVVLQ
jgi:hypothetical protein